VVQGAVDALGDLGLGQDAGKLLLEQALSARTRGTPRFRRTAALIGAAAADRLLDSIERGDTRKRLAGDRLGAALGDVEEAPPQTQRAESQRDRVVRGGVGNGLVGGIAVAPELRHSRRPGRHISDNA
jgi:hypothetical protein